jgi:hypothetical protein
MMELPFLQIRLAILKINWGQLHFAAKYNSQNVVKHCPEIIKTIGCPGGQFFKKLASGGMVVASSPHATEETAAMGREIESRYAHIFRVVDLKNRPWQRGIVDIASAYRTEDPGFRIKPGCKIF